MKHKSGFGKFFNLFFVSIFVLFLINSIVLLYLSNRGLMSESSKIYAQKAETIAQMLDDSLSAPLVQIVFDHFGAFQNSSMLNFLIYENKQDSEVALSREIATNIVRHKWLKSIIVYREDGKVVADYAMQKNLSDSTREVQLEGIIRAIQKKKSTNGWIAHAVLNDKTDLLLYYVKYPMTNPMRNRGIVLYAIDPSALAGQINQIIDPVVENVVIEDDSGQTLFSFGNASLPSWFNGTKPNNLIETTVWKDAEKTWQVIWSPLSNQNLSLALTVSMDKLLKTQLYSLRLNVALVVLFAVGLIFYLLFVKHNFQNPITKTLDALHVLVHSKSDTAQKISFKQDAQKIINENEDLIAYRFLINLITKGMDRAEFEKVGSVLGLSDCCSPFHILLVEQNPTLLKNLDWAEREQEQEALKVQWESLFPKERALTIRYPSGSLVSSCFVDTSFCLSFGAIFAFAERTQSNIAFSPALSDPADCPQVYTQLRNVLDNKVFYGFGNVFSCEEIASSAWIALPRDSLKELLMRERYDEFMKALSLDIKEMERKNVPPVMMRDYFIRLSGIVNEVYQRKEPSRNITALCYFIMRQEIEQLSGIKEFIAWTEQKIGLLKDAVQRARKEDNKALVERIRAYIYESIFQNLTEEAVAAHFGISTGYLSRLFKEFSPGGFSAYLKECKLEAAAQLLREKKCKSISELAQKLGYSSTTYFSRQFKKRFGLLPHEYSKCDDTMQKQETFQAPLRQAE